MRSFEDRTNRKWTLDITIATVERVKAVCAIDLPGLIDKRMAPLDALLADDMKLAEVVFECCKQAESESESPRTFDDLKAVWNGDTADAAVKEFLQELAGFFRDPGRRAAISKAIQGIQDLGTKVLEKAQASINPEIIDATAEKIVDLMRKGLVTESNGSSGNMPATSESIPDPSPSAN